jgi:hypothetical protein
MHLFKRDRHIENFFWVTPRRCDPSSLQEENAMQFVLLIYQGTTPLPNSEEWEKLSGEEKQRVYTDYEALNKAPGVTPGLPLGLPKDATTVRVQGGEILSTKAPFVSANGAIGGYFVLETDSLDAAIRLAARIPAARLGGAIEIRPAAKYW